MDFPMDTSEKVKDFINKLLEEHGYTEEVKSSDSLILSGLLDSLAVVHIVVFLEQQFGIDFSDIYFDQTDFDSIDQVMKFITTNK